MTHHMHRLDMLNKYLADILKHMQDTVQHLWEVAHPDIPGDGCCKGFGMDMPTAQVHPGTATRMACRPDPCPFL